MPLGSIYQQVLTTVHDTLSSRPQLTLKRLTHTYSGDRIALCDVSMELHQGIVGLIGPNGAGKSSLMSIISTLRKPSSGEVRWCGNDLLQNPQVVRSALGYLPQSFGVLPTLTAAEFLQYLAAVKGLHPKLAKQRSAFALECVGLAEFANQRLGTFSGGMRQRIGIAQALLNDPKLLIFDEPTVGLDPTERLRFRLLLSELALDRLIILSTHIVSDIETSASQIVVLHRGHLRYHGDLPSLLRKAQGKVWECTVPVNDVDAIRSRWEISDTARCIDGLRVRIIAPQPPLPDAIPALPRFEDAYLAELALQQEH